METMKDFEFIDFATSRGGRRNSITSQRYITISHSARKGGVAYRVGISKTISEEIAERQLTHFRIRIDNYTQRLHLIFLKGDDTMGEIHLERSGNYRIANKRLVEFLAKRMGLKGDFPAHYIELGNNLSNSAEYLTYELMIEELKKSVGQ